MTWKELKELAKEKGVKDTDTVEMHPVYFYHDPIGVEFYKIDNNKWRLVPVSQEHWNPRDDVGR
jgi:hypothetical protein